MQLSTDGQPEPAKALLADINPRPVPNRGVTITRKSKSKSKEIIVHCTNHGKTKLYKTRSHTTAYSTYNILQTQQNMNGKTIFSPSISSPPSSGKTRPPLSLLPAAAPTPSWKGILRSSRAGFADRIHLQFLSNSKTPKRTSPPHDEPSDESSRLLLNVSPSPSSLGAAPARRDTAASPVVDGRLFTAASLTTFGLSL